MWPQSYQLPSYISFSQRVKAILSVLFTYVRVQPITKVRRKILPFDLNNISYVQLCDNDRWRRVRETTLDVQPRQHIVAIFLHRKVCLFSEVCQGHGKLISSCHVSREVPVSSVVGVSRVQEDVVKDHRACSWKFCVKWQPRCESDSSVTWR